MIVRVPSPINHCIARIKRARCKYCSGPIPSSFRNLRRIVRSLCPLSRASSELRSAGTIVRPSLHKEHPSRRKHQLVPRMAVKGIPHIFPHVEQPKRLSRLPVDSQPPDHPLRFPHRKTFRHVAD